MNAVCEVCLEASGRYKCPKCHCRTCSLSCNKQHKAAKDCDGVRDKTKFVDNKSYGDINLLSDYRLLEESSRSITSIRRDILRNVAKDGAKPSHVVYFLKAAHKRGISLRFLPFPLSGRCNNSSYVNFRKRKIIWQIEWIAPSIDVKFIQTEVNEDTTLSDALHSLLDFKEPRRRQNTGIELNNPATARTRSRSGLNISSTTSSSTSLSSINDFSSAYQLHKYISRASDVVAESASSNIEPSEDCDVSQAAKSCQEEDGNGDEAKCCMSQFRFFMKIDCLNSSNKSQYYRMDPNKSICHNLQGKLVIEFPHIYVVTKNDADQYHVVEDKDVIYPQLPRIYVMDTGPSNPLKRQGRHDEEGNYKSRYRGRGRGFNNRGERGFFCGRGRGGNFRRGGHGNHVDGASGGEDIITSPSDDTQTKGEAYPMAMNTDKEASEGRPAFDEHSHQSVAHSTTARFGTGRGYRGRRTMRRARGGTSRSTRHSMRRWN